MKRRDFIKSVVAAAGMPMALTRAPKPDSGGFSDGTNLDLRREVDRFFEEQTIPDHEWIGGGQRFWTGKAGNGTWEDPKNWSNNRMPVSGDSVAFLEGSPGDKAIVKIPDKLCINELTIGRDFKGTIG